METKLKKALYLDDVRTPIDALPGYESWVVVRNYQQFTDYLKDNGVPDLISFDHDLAEEHMNDYFDQMAKMGWQSPNYTEYKEKTGLDCAKYLCDAYAVTWDTTGASNFPICVVHSHNPVGAENIMSYINGFIKHYKIDSVCYEQRFQFYVDK